MIKTTRLEPDSLCPVCQQPALHPVITGRRIVLACRCYERYTEDEIAARFALEFLEASVFGQQIEMELVA